LAEVRASKFLKRRGEEVYIYRRTVVGVDELNRTEYTWALQYSSGVWSRWDIIKSSEIVKVAGEIIVADFRVFFQHDEDVLKDDHLLRDGSRFEVVAVQPKRVCSQDQFLVVYARRMVS